MGTIGVRKQIKYLTTVAIFVVTENTRGFNSFLGFCDIHNKSGRLTYKPLGFMNIDEALEWIHNLLSIDVKFRTGAKEQHANTSGEEADNQERTAVILYWDTKQAYFFNKLIYILIW